LTLRRRILFFKWTLWLGGVTAVLALAPALHTSTTYFIPVVALFVWVTHRRASRVIVRGAYRRLRRLIEAEDYAGARALIAELTALYAGSRSALEGLRLQEAGVLSHEGRYPEAAALYASLDAGRLGAGWKPLLLNNLAWTLALSGDAPTAVQRARESLEASDKTGDRAVGVVDLRSYQLGTLGTALVLAGEPGEGVRLLEQAFARGGKPREQAARSFFLGEGLRALGRHEDAAQAYRRAVQLSPACRFGKRAQASLEGLRAYRS
jgi:tetratricopeptide (TPR) repeat protein